MKVALGLAAALMGAAACGGQSTAGDTTTTTTATEAVAPDASWVETPATTTDAGPTTVCPPSQVTFTTGTYLPRKPPRQLSACAAGQVTEILGPCEVGVGVCGNFAAKTQPCLSCLFARHPDATFGYRVFTPEAPNGRLNVRGYALRAGAPEACANAIEDYRSCLDAACTCAGASRTESCYTKAVSAGCKATGDAAVATCAKHPAEALLRPIVEADGLGDEAAAVAMGKAFCGGT